MCIEKDNMASGAVSDSTSTSSSQPPADPVPTQVSIKLEGLSDKPSQP